jgi:hypothetical protein
MKISAEEARKFVLYEPETGVFYYTSRRSNATRKDALAGTNTPRGARKVYLAGRQYLAHRVAFLLMTGQWPTHVIDHIDGDPSNNRWANLRDVPQKTNSYNVRSIPAHKKHSTLMGAHWCAQGQLWKSSIKVDGKVIRLGVFDTERQASDAYIAAKRKYHPGFML